jgi:anti-sigma factor RsiW
MNCHELDNLLFPYLDGEFSAPERAELDQHLASCADCAARVEKERLTHDALRGLMQEHSPPASQALRDRIRVGLDAEDARLSRAHYVPRIALAAGVLVAVAASYPQYRAWKVRQLADEAASRYARPFPLEIQSASPEQLQDWFRGKLDHRVAVPRFPNAAPAGARLVSVRGNDAAMIRYTVNASNTEPRMGLFVFADTRGEVDVPNLPDVAITASHGYNVVSARDGDLVYILTTDTNLSDVEALRSALQTGVRPSMQMPQPVTPQVMPVSLQH